jgi:DNA-nicking Smr family endonuclease
MSTGRRGRRLSDDERALWRTVTREIAPLRPRPSADSPDAVVADQPPPTEVVASEEPARATPRTKTPTPLAVPPPLAPLEKRLRQRLGRGSETPDSRIDLHGMTQDRAHRALLSFLRRAQADGARVVLVITGKGARGPASEPGVLRRAVPQWLALPEFRSFVVGYEIAHVTHGGEGALYVRVRRGRNRL